MSEFLDDLTVPQKDSIDRLRRALAGSHFTDIKVRTGGKDLYFEGDWIREALDKLCDPSPVWKLAFLFTRRVIDKLLARHLCNPYGAVQLLLVHHLRKTSELLGADVNGGLDEEYEAEAQATLGRQHE